MNTPAENQQMTHAAQSAGALSTEAQRAVEEVQAAMTIAQRFPRDIDRALQRIEAECGQLKLADGATYSYKRDKQLVEGPSIRLLEVFTRHWQNLEAGWRELSRSIDPATGYQVAECEAYAWDMESNSRERRLFRVILARFYRDRPAKALLDPRDQYEYMASMAQRRKRSCLEAIVPQWAVDQALQWCKTTIEEKVQITDATVEKLINAYADIGVSRAQLEEYLEHPVTVAELTRREYMRLRSIGQSIRDGESKARDFFGGETPDQPDDINLTAQVNAQANGQKQAAPKQPQQAAQPEPQQAPTGDGAPGEDELFAQIDEVLAHPGKYSPETITELAALSDAVSPNRAEEFRSKLGQAYEAMKGGQNTQAEQPADNGVQGAFFGG